MVRVAVAFSRLSGVELLPELRDYVEGGGRFRLLAGTDFELTDLESVLALDRPPTAECRVYCERGLGVERRNFHPKIYLFERQDEVVACVGSSNLTGGGLLKNVEANLLVKGGEGESPIRELREFHETLWGSPWSLRVTPDFRSRYAEAQARRRAIESRVWHETDYGRASRGLQRIVAETVLTYGQPADTRTWLLITSPENYLRNIDGRIWGDEKQGRISRVRTGDLIYFYVTRPLHAIGAVGLVTGNPYEDRTPYWSDRLYPYRFRFELLVRCVPPIPIRPLVSQLELFRRDPEQWGQRLQRSAVELSPSDAALLRATVLAEPVEAA